MGDWFSLENWPPTEQTDLNPVIDVEDISMMQMKLDNGVLASYQQCHFTPDYWRNYTVIGTAGRLENFGDDAGNMIKVWNTRSQDGYVDADIEVEIEAADGGHGGADPRLIAEFLRFAARGRTDGDLAGRRPCGGCRRRAGHRVAAHRRFGQGRSGTAARNCWPTSRPTRSAPPSSPAKLWPRACKKSCQWAEAGGFRKSCFREPLFPAPAVARVWRAWARRAFPRPPERFPRAAAGTACAQGLRRTRSTSRRHRSRGGTER